MASTSQQSALLPVYLIAGEDELKRETVLKRLHARLEKMGDLSFNSEVFSASTCTGEQIVAAANTLPFASEMRLVEVHDVEKLKKGDLDTILEYLKAPCATTVLALVAQKVAKNARILKAVTSFDKKAYIDCTPFARKDLGKVVRSMAVGHGITFTEGAAATLVDLVGVNTVALDGEIQKLALSHRGSDPVNENEVLSLVSRTAEVKPWEFVDAFSGRNAKRCLYLLNRMESVSPYALLPMCVNRIRELLSVKALVRRNEASSIASVLKMPAWRVKNHQAWARAFTEEELIDALRAARDAEKDMKSGADASETLIRWVLSVCVRKG